jgi:hypothetical protein
MATGYGQPDMETPCTDIIDESRKTLKIALPGVNMKMPGTGQLFGGWFRVRSRPE